MTYTGEHPLPGIIGHVFIALALATALLSFFTYGMASSQKEKEIHTFWKKRGRQSFYFTSLVTFGFIATLFYILVKQYFEYHYVWEHSNSTMNFKYILVCFWSGQEGSFMLWMFWHCVLGLILLRKSREWEPEVMAVFALVQVFLATMLLGIYIGEHKIGSNPFLLQREASTSLGTLWSLMPDYLQVDPRFADGKGLNPLLQNYWMVIHPPTLFLGFAATLIPFAYAVAGLWRKQHTAWMKPAIPYSVFGVMVLGTGILMGGAWAYESLSFGGFWAWDPVENASLVPWITLVGTVHLLLVNKHHPRSVYFTYFSALITFILILYSTFLTRSGVLGDTSVHSFTGDGMLGQLLLFLVLFIWIAIVLLLQENKSRIRFTIISLALVIFGFSVDLNTILLQEEGFILTWRGLLLIVSITLCIIFILNNYIRNFSNNEEENLYSREFWIFIGTSVLILSALQILFNTSIPVINSLFDTKISLIDPEERNAFYNNWQTPFATVIALLAGFTQFLKYRSTERGLFFKNILPAFIISLLLSFAAGYLFKLNGFQYHLLLFASVFAIIANGDYWIRIMKGRLMHAGSSIAHVGIGFILLGALISQNRQVVISSTKDNYKLDRLDSKYSNDKDIILFRGDTTIMEKYFVAFRGRIRDGHNLKYKVDYYDQQPAQYQKGEMVKHNGAVYRCLENHTASDQLNKDASRWEPVNRPSQKEFLQTKQWLAVEPGDYLFTLYPFVQLNKQMGNVAEPGTKRFWNYDIFTHIKFANLTDPDIEKDTTITVSFNVKEADTIATPGALIEFMGLHPLPDSLKKDYNLDSNALAVFIPMRLFNIFDMRLEYPVETKAIFIIENGQITNVPGYASELGLKVHVKNIIPGEQKIAPHDHSIPGHEHHTEFEKAELEIDLVSNEFLVMQAIRFPMINLLWAGAVLMFLGSLMAIINRVRKNRRA